MAREVNDEVRHHGTVERPQLAGLQLVLLRFALSPPRDERHECIRNDLCAATRHEKDT